MRSLLGAFSSIAAIATIAACQTTAGPEVVTSPGEGAAPGGYAICGGQNQKDVSALPRSGPVTEQLAPAYLDQMAACSAKDALPAERIAKAGDGVINEKGDCEFAAIGVTCHFHSGSEFLATQTSTQVPGQGEMHCIFSGSEAKSPEVFGAQIVCKDRAQGEPGGAPASHDVKAGAACSSAVLTQLSACQSFRCCDDGTLTNPIADLVRDGKNDLRPDFRICGAPIEIDCSTLGTMAAHDANSPALGGIGEAAFAPHAASEGH